MDLIIAEKHDLAKQIMAAIDGIERNGVDCVYKGNYCITWLSGHLMVLKQPAEYDPELAKWKLDTLPIYYRNWELVPKDGDGKGRSPRERLQNIKQLIDKCRCVIHAGDMDDEGQFLVDEALQYLECTKPIYRLNTGDTTAPSLRRALQHMEPNSRHERFGRAAYARAVADITFGINASRYFSISNNAKLYVGRVQTPTLGLVVARDKQIEGHKKIKYYTIAADVLIGGQTVSCKYEPQKDDPNLTDGRILSESYAQQVAAMIQTKRSNRATVTAKDVLEAPPLPFDLVSLQTYCGRKFGMTPQDVMVATQSLRTKYNAITYNRSDCRYLYDNNYDEAPDTMQQVIQNIRYKPKELNMAIRSKCFDSSKIDNHSAIIPQNTPVDIQAMTRTERDVYLAICKYYMCQFMPPAKKRRFKLEVQLPDGGKLVAASTTVTEDGYLKLFKNDAKDGSAEDETALSKIPVGDHPCEIRDVTVSKGETKPPQRYTQSSLNDDMTRISKYVDDPEIKSLLLAKDKGKTKEIGSIGTVATRAPIISDLIKHGFLREEGKYIISTPIGRELIRILPPEISKPDLTARWWVIQEDIRHDEADYTALTDSVFEYVKHILTTEYAKVDSSLITTGGGRGRQEIGKCPKCGRSVVEYDKSFSCTGWRDESNPCKFSIWKKSKSPMLAETTFSASNVRAFLEGRPVRKKNLISTKTGKKFEADLIMKYDPQYNAPSFTLDFSKVGYKRAPKTKS